jgi:hypothetical protein
MYFLAVERCRRNFQVFFQQLDSLGGPPIGLGAIGEIKGA